jgi:hypothetical protein
MSAPSTHRPDRGLLLALLLVLLAAVAVVLTSPAGTPAPVARSSSGDLVSTTALACPDLAPAPRTRADVRVGLAPAEPGLPGGTVVRGPADDPAGTETLERGALLDVPPADRDGGPALGAEGPAAAGLFATRADVARGHALGVTGCPAPRAEWWFTGAGAGLDHDSTLLLANVDPGPAVVDLRVLGPDGDVDTVSGRGVLVAPHSRKRVALADIAPQTDDLALSVHAERGRVVAAVDDSLRTTATARPGQEWLPGAEAPSRTVRIAGPPGRASRRTLLVANPSGLETVVDLRVSGSGGTFTPTGLEPVTVAPGTLRSIDLTRALARTVRPGEPVALRLRSEHPVVATLRSAVGGDETLAPTVLPLTGPAAAPLVPGTRATVQVGAESSAARVRVTAYGARGRRLDETSLKLDPQTTAGWSPKPGAAYVVVSPARPGTVSGAVGYTGEGAGAATVPLTPLPLRQQRPPVRPGLP